MIPYPFSEESRRLVVEALCNEQVLVFPTETVYGLGGSALSAKALRRVYELKGRHPEKALPVLVDQSWLKQLASWRDGRVDRIIKVFWPGPLTLILPACPDLPGLLSGPSRSIALRWSESAVVEELIRLGSCPVIGTSANRSGRPECLTPEAVENQFQEQTPLLVDGGTLPPNPPTTLLDCTGERFRILRTGTVTSFQLQPFL